MSIRLLPFEARDGQVNMAVDELLLEMAAEAGIASLRFYGWRPATLSLGYFQPAAARLSQPRLAQLAWVRRPSGGATLVHDRELTYCLALPAGPPWQTGAPWPARMHRIIADALGQLGVANLELAGATHSDQKTLCFQQQTPGDLLCRGVKIVGSAQRKHKRALLQHGAILLVQSRYAPELPGIAELTGLRLTAGPLQAALIEAFQRETGWTLQADFTVPEQADFWRRAQRLRLTELVEKYRSWEWNMKR
jgi:lipoate-protein ligase A